MQTLILKPGKERSLLRRHPWIFANAIDRVEGKPASGATVIVRAHNGQFLARAAFSRFISRATPLILEAVGQVNARTART